MIRRHPGLHERFRAAKPISRVMGCGPEPHYVRRPVGDGWALAGELLEVTADDRLVLTTRGRLLSNELFARLV